MPPFPSFQLQGIIIFPSTMREFLWWHSIICLQFAVLSANLYHFTAVLYSLFVNLWRGLSKQTSPITEEALEHLMATVSIWVRRWLQVVRNWNRTVVQYDVINLYYASICILPMAKFWIRMKIFNTAVPEY